MPKIPNTILRGKTYYLRMRIPKELVSSYGGKKEIQRTLQTSDATEARRKARLEAFLLGEEFEAKKNEHALRAHDRPLSDLSDAEITAMVIRWYREKNEEQYNEDLTYTNPDNQSDEDILQNLREEQSEKAYEIAEKRYIGRTVDIRTRVERKDCYDYGHLVFRHQR